MPAPYVTHFADSDLDLSQPQAKRATLCGRSWDSIIMNDRPATCELCRSRHAAMTGWSFPLPAVVE